MTKFWTYQTSYYENCNSVPISDKRNVFTWYSSLRDSYGKVCLIIVANISHHHQNPFIDVKSMYVRVSVRSTHQQLQTSLAYLNFYFQKTQHRGGDVRGRIRWWIRSHSALPPLYCRLYTDYTRCMHIPESIWINALIVAPSYISSTDWSSSFFIFLRISNAQMYWLHIVVCILKIQWLISIL